ncbi:MAG: hypothetical protein J7J44_02855 [Deltaproteobacteria bacterium]|nr:hypothetical protein [Deltaproteobacteria bacterium]
MLVPQIVKPLQPLRDELIETAQKIRTISNSYYIADIIGIDSTLDSEIQATLKLIRLATRHLNALYEIKKKEEVEQ